MPKVSKLEQTKKNPTCPACIQKMNYTFSARLLSKYDVSYYKCLNCGLLQTEKPYWLDEAYGSAIASLDVGLVQRNQKLSGTVSKFVSAYFDPLAKYLDFAGGYGLFVRLMRDKGYDFYRYDKYCENIFAEYFDEPTLSDELLHFELVTAFEVFEHVYDPVVELVQLFKLTDTVLFTTELIPSGINNIDDWWYFVPETGQHITFYTELSLQKIADKLSVNFYSNKKSLHMMTRREFDSNPFLMHDETSMIDRVRIALSEKFALPLKSNLSNEDVSIEKDFQHIRSKAKHN